MIKCDFCTHFFKTQTSLANHQKTAKYCLKKRGEKIKVFSCDYCNKKLSTKQRLLSHMDICIEKVTTFTEEKLSEKDKLILELKEQVSKLQDQLVEIASQAVSRPVTINNQNNKRKILMSFFRVQFPCDKFFIVFPDIPATGFFQQIIAVIHFNAKCIQGVYYFLGIGDDSLFFPG